MNTKDANPNSSAESIKPKKGFLGFLKKGPPSEDKWRSSAQEELNNFKGIPVVGGLPWKFQYFVLAGVLSICVLILVFLVRSGDASKQNNLEGLVAAPSHMALAISSGSEKDAESALSAKLPESASSSVKEAWAKFRGTGEAWVDNERKIQAFQNQAGSVYPELESALQIIGSSWSGIIAEEMNTTKEGVLLAQLEGNLMALSDGAKSIKEGAPIPSGYEDKFNNVIRIFAEVRSSPILGVDSSLSRAWRSAGNSWGRSVSKIKNLAESNGNKLLSDRRKIQSDWVKASNELNLALAGMSSSGVKKSVLPTFVAIVAIVVLLLMVWVSVKQNRWQVLNERAVNESNEAAMLSLIDDFNAVATGDLLRHVRVDDERMSTLGDVVNSMLESIRNQINEAKLQSRKLINGCDDASEVIHGFVDRGNHQLSTVNGNIDKMMSVGMLGGEIKNDFNVLLDQSQQVFSILGSAIETTAELLSSLEQAHARQEEASGRIHRLESSNQEVSRQSVLMKELAEQFHIVSIQAGLQAAKSSESGGFKVIAETLSSLSSSARSNSEQTHSLSGTTLADLEALTSSNIRGAGEVDKSVDLLNGLLHVLDDIRNRLKLIANVNKDFSEKVSGLTEVSEELETMARTESSRVQDLEDRLEHAVSTSETIVTLARENNATLMKFKG